MSSSSPSSPSPKRHHTHNNADADVAIKRIKPGVNTDNAFLSLVVDAMELVYRYLTERDIANASTCCTAAFDWSTNEHVIQTKFVTMKFTSTGIAYRTNSFRCDSDNRILTHSVVRPLPRRVNHIQSLDVSITEPAAVPFVQPEVEALTAHALDHKLELQRVELAVQTTLQFVDYISRCLNASACNLVSLYIASWYRYIIIPAMPQLTLMRLHNFMPLCRVGGDQLPTSTPLLPSLKRLTLDNVSITSNSTNSIGPIVAITNWIKTYISTKLEVLEIRAESLGEFYTCVKWCRPRVLSLERFYPISRGVYVTQLLDLLEYGECEALFIRNIYEMDTPHIEDKAVIMAHCTQQLVRITCIDHSARFVAFFAPVFANYTQYHNLQMIALSDELPDVDTLVSCLDPLKRSLTHLFIQSDVDYGGGTFIELHNFVAFSELTHVVLNIIGSHSTNNGQRMLEQARSYGCTLRYFEALVAMPKLQAVSIPYSVLLHYIADMPDNIRLSDQLTVFYLSFEEGVKELVQETREFIQRHVNTTYMNRRIEYTPPLHKFQLFDTTKTKHSIVHAFDDPLLEATGIENRVARRL